ncbi:MAG TPA: HAEPLYID family protein [Luteibaculaceae bacterium]|nr:HAEPLYID family protein [Luteibaculaceae bacterium]
MTFRILFICLLAGVSGIAGAQITDSQRDSLYINEVQQLEEPDKVLHAEPLFIDLIRDLGARKGEREWNVGLGLVDNLKYDTYETLVEYEWAPVNRLGLEVELPFTFYSPLNGTDRALLPSHRLKSLKTAAQYTFLVNQRHATSMAIGYIHEFKLPSFDEFQSPGIRGHVYNPFFIAAKRWGSRMHGLIYAGPVWDKPNGSKAIDASQINTSFHYMIPGTRNFIGLEVNTTQQGRDTDITFRPQMRLSVTDRVLIGIVAGIPVNRENQRFSTFARLIWEPMHKSR